MMTITITWELICDIILLIEGVLGMFWASLFLIALLKHRLYRKSPLALLVGNASLAGLLFHCVVIIQSVHMIIGRPDLYCVLRGHLVHSFVGAVYHSICLQALHRLFVIVFANRRRLQNPKVLVTMTIVQWIFSLTFCLPKLNPYPMISDMCLGPFNRRYVFVHLAVAVYLLPLILLIIVYSLIIRYIKQNTSVYILQRLSIQHRLRREVTILRRIITPVVIMLVTGFPMVTFFVQGQLSLTPPFYAVRMGMISLTGGTALAMLMNIIFTDSVRQHLLCERCCLIPTRSKKTQILVTYQLDSASQSIPMISIKNCTTTVNNVDVTV
jgi:hypothetical protein